MAKKLYEYTEKGVKNRIWVFEQIYNAVHEIVNGAPVADDTPARVKAAIEEKYETLAEEGYLVEVQPKKKAKK